MVRRSVAWITVAVVLAVTGAALFFVQRVSRDDDVLSFLPQDNPDIQHFYDINKRFGGLDIAMVGIRTDDPFDPEFLETLRTTTKNLAKNDHVSYALSLATVQDFMPDLVRGGIIQAALVDEIPDDAEAKAALRDKVMSRELVVGNLISADEQAVLIYCYGAHGSEPREVAENVQKTVEVGFPRHMKYWGGAPFVSSYIFETVKDDMARLTPYAVIAIILLMMFAFRDVIGSFVVLLSTGMGILIAVGAMGLAGKDYNVVLSSMPIILFAVGSAYGIHVLSRYYKLAARMEPEEALVATLVGIGPTVATAGLTTVAGLASFVMMDIEPMRTFGIFTALGILATLVLSLTFVPAVIRLSNLTRRDQGPERTAALTVRLTALARRRRLLIGLVLAAITAAGASLVSRVDARVDMSSFYEDESSPGRAEQFLTDHFGGSQFLQLHFKGDLTDPHVLREIRRAADHIAMLDVASLVLHPGQVIAQANGAIEQDQRIPDSGAKVKELFGILSGNKALDQLVDRRHTEALVHVKLASSRPADVERAMEAVEAYLRDEAITRFERLDGDAAARDPRAVARRRELASTRVQAHLKRYGQALPDALRGRLADHLESAPAASIALERVTVPLQRYLQSDECLAPLEDAAVAQRVAHAVAALGPAPQDEALTAALTRAVGARPAEEGNDGSETLVDDLLASLGVPLEEVWRRARFVQRAERLIAELALTVPDGSRGERFVGGLADALIDLNAPSVMLPASANAAQGTLAVQVNGLPLLHRGLSRSVTQNQLESLGLALGLVLLIMTVLFRSLWGGLLATSPMIITLAVIYGGMAVLGVHLDIGTSMLASLIIGAGVDYAVHLLAEWRAPPGASGDLVGAAERAATWTGHSIWTNATMVAAGFFVLTLGEAKPLKNVGGLTAASMLIAALATFLAIPILARRGAYRRANIEKGTG